MINHSTFTNERAGRRFLFSIIRAGCLFILTCAVFGQDVKTSERVQALKTPLLKKKTTVYYSPGYKKRAREIQSLMEDALTFYERQLGSKVELSVAVLDKSQWQQVANLSRTSERIRLRRAASCPSHKFWSIWKKQRPDF